MRLNDPELAFRRFRLQDLEGNACQCHDRSRAQLVRPEHDDAGIFRWTVSANIGEIEVQRQEDSGLLTDDFRNFGIGSAGLELIENLQGVMTLVSKKVSRRGGQILIELELHAGSGSGRVTTRSRASSAA